MTHYENIPEELRSLDQWVCVREGSKIPLQAELEEAATSTDPRTWSPFDAAHAAVSKGRYDYLGFVFRDNGIVGIDIDAGVDEDGFMTPLAADIIGHCESYTERSKSGRGFHILLKGDLPFRGKNNLAGVEIYRDARYFIMTGNTVVFSEIVENQAAIDYILERYFPETLRQNGDRPASSRIYTPVWEPPVGNRIKLRPVYPRIPDGCRNICLTSLAGMLHNQGYSPQQIYDELTYVNVVACDPSLPENELYTIVSSVTRYKR